MGTLAKIATDAPLGTSWPPPATRVEYVGSATVLDPVIGGATAWEVVADSGELPTSGFWWTTLGELVAGSIWDSPEGDALLLQAYRLLVSGFAGVVSAIPVYFSAGEAIKVRWLRSTFRGNLDGVEQFQHKIDWGKPGADPTTSEAAQLALAEDLATKWSAALTVGGHLSEFPVDVVYTEVGVVEIVQTDASDKFGNGGNPTESNTTAWFMYPVGSRPSGTQAISLPYEVSMAVTLQTDHRGPSGRGRFYLPPFAKDLLAAGGRFNSAIITEFGALIGGFFNAVEADHDLVPVVVSGRRMILNEVTTANIGVIPDSQRRRRRSQDEARVLVWTKP